MSFTNASGGPFVAPPAIGSPLSNIDPTGTNDSRVAITNALAAAAANAATGVAAPPGVVLLPFGNYKLNSRLRLLNPGVTLMGAAPPGASTVGPVRLFAGASISNLILVQALSNALIGGGLKNLVLDGGANVTAQTLLKTASQWGQFENLSIVGAPGQMAVQTQSIVGSVGIIPNNQMHNSWKKIVITPGTANNSGALVCIGNGSDATTNTSYDYWEDLTIPWQSAGSAIFIRALWLQSCDNVYFRNVHMFGVAPVGTNVGLQLDYSGTGAAVWPADCLVEAVDFGGAAVSIVNVGVPAAGATINRVQAIAKTNGQPANPALANLGWGPSNPPDAGSTAP